MSGHSVSAADENIIGPLAGAWVPRQAETGTAGVRLR